MDDFNPSLPAPAHKLTASQRDAICKIATLGVQAVIRHHIRNTLIRMHIVIPTGFGHRTVKLTAKGIWFHCAILASEADALADDASSFQSYQFGDDTHV